MPSPPPTFRIPHSFPDFLERWGFPAGTTTRRVLATDEIRWRGGKGLYVPCAMHGESLSGTQYIACRRGGGGGGGGLVMRPPCAMWGVGTSRRGRPRELDRDDTHATARTFWIRRSAPSRMGKKQRTIERKTRKRPASSGKWSRVSGGGGACGARHRGVDYPIIHPPIHPSIHPSTIYLSMQPCIYIYIDT